jgi:hypothetical protein
MSETHTHLSIREINVRNPLLQSFGEPQQPFVFFFKDEKTSRSAQTPAVVLARVISGFLNASRHFPSGPGGIQWNNGMKAANACA